MNLIEWITYDDPPTQMMNVIIEELIGKED